jgi:hypothetical protein
MVLVKFVIDNIPAARSRIAVYQQGLQPELTLWPQSIVRPVVVAGEQRARPVLDVQKSEET